MPWRSLGGEFSSSAGKAAARSDERSVVARWVWQEKKHKTNQNQISSSFQLALSGQGEDGRGKHLSRSPSVGVCAHVHGYHSLKIV